MPLVKKVAVATEVEEAAKPARTGKRRPNACDDEVVVVNALVVVNEELISLLVVVVVDILV